MRQVMDVIQRKVFYSTVRIICGLFCLLSLQALNAEPAASKVLHPQGLLWKLQKTGQPDSYLFGTIHMSDDRVLRLVDVVDDSIINSDVFAMEVLLDKAGQQSLAQSTFFSSGELLQDYIDDVMLDQINIIMFQYYGIRPAVVNQMKPWAVMATISSPPPESNKTVLDIELQNLAAEHQRTVIGLETVEEQMQVLAGMKLSDQLWLLTKTVEDFHETMPMWERLVESYLRRDLQALMKEQESMMDDSSTIDDRFMEKLLDKRNVVMAERMMSIMKNNSLFAAIGALHLPGKKGVLHLLEKAGYQVSPVY